MYIHPTNIYWVPPVYQILVLGAGDTTVNKTDKNPALLELIWKWERHDNKQMYDRRLEKDKCWEKNNIEGGGGGMKVLL